jgi:hypothetical protein
VSLAYNGGNPPPAIPGQRKLTGTRHEPGWTPIIRKVRRAVKEAASNASWREDVTPDAVGMRILDHLHEYDPGSLHVLDVVNSILIRASRH